MTTETARPEIEEPQRPLPAKESQAGTIKLFFRKLGPGLVTGASDDDPSGIGTYSQIGAQFGYGLLWTMLLSYPLMAAIQEISARIGRVTGCGIAAFRKNYPKPLLYSVLVVMSIANVFNLGADIGAMGAALKLLLPGNINIFTVTSGVASLIAVMFIPYSTYVKYLKWLTVSLFAYVGVVFFVRVPWSAVLHASLIPHIQLTKAYLTALIAVLGTTISPYLFFGKLRRRGPLQETCSYAVHNQTRVSLWIFERNGRSPIMRPDIMPGGIFPDYELPDHTDKLRKLSELQGDDPLILTLARGHYCPKEHQQHLELAAFYPKIAVAYTQIATIATDDHHTLQEFRASVGAAWTFLSDPDRTVQKDLDIQEYTDPEHNPMIPHTLVLKPGLVIYSIYNGYWFWGRPSVIDLWHDLRAVTSEIRPDWDLSIPGLREAWSAGDLSRFHGWNKRASVETASIAGKK
jgi:peroxiredoxin